MQSEAIRACASEAQSANHLTPSEPADLGAESGEFGLLLEETPIRLHDERDIVQSTH
jgi:hypothetical protein